MKESKAALRRVMRERLKLIGETRVAKSQAICDHVARHPAYALAKRVALFDAMASEPDLEPLWGTASRHFYYPRVAGVELHLIEVADLAGLAASPFRGGYREPEGNAKPLDLTPLDLILVPGLAFTREGGRMGRGGGFYDRLLARLPERTATIGICFDCQLVADLPTEPHDGRVGSVITESGVWIACR